MLKKNKFKIPNDWEYKGEGNCHVVLGLPKLKKVLRIRKRDKPHTLLQWFYYFIEDIFSLLYDKCALDETRDLSFHLKIMRPLFGYKYVSSAEQVRLYSRQVKQIEYQLSKVRPDCRKRRILHYRRATLFHDFTTLDTDYLPFKLAEDVYSIEIKPKKGWIPFSEKHFPECIYCMNQYIKLNAKKISSPSNYCPKDLFSGEEKSIINSILSLIENPQNNFKIFKNGQVVYDENANKENIPNVIKQFLQASGENEELLKNFSYLLYKCLTTNFGSEEQCKAKLFCKWDGIIQGDILPKGCILDKILSIQMFDVEGIKYYSKLINNETSDWGYVDKLLKALDSKMCVKCSLLLETNTEHSKRRDLAFAPYLIAAVANDCSLMITLKKIQDEMDDMEMKNVVKTKFGSFIVNIGVFDLYPKPVSTINKHVLRNEKLLEVYNGLNN